MKAPHGWSPSEWKTSFEALFTFLCSQEWGEVRTLLDMDSEQTIQAIEALFVAMITHDRSVRDPNTLRERRALLLSSIKGLESYANVIEIADIVRLDPKKQGVQ
jgi:hypothetical protein